MQSETYKMKSVPVRVSTVEDFADWLALAKEVEPLFGPMTDDPNFHAGLRQAIAGGSALCVSDAAPGGSGGVFHGGIVISVQANEIVWLAVAQPSRGLKIGAALLAEALRRLDPARPVTVTTFDPTMEAGIPARRLYQSFGFRDTAPAGLNPAGCPTVTMTREKPPAGPATHAFAQPDDASRGR